MLGVIAGLRYKPCYSIVAARDPPRAGDSVHRLHVEVERFVGHAHRRLRHTLLHHGTILYGFDLGLIDTLLPEPPRRPAWRVSRRHSSPASWRSAEISALEPEWRWNHCSCDCTLIH